METREQIPIAAGSRLPCSLVGSQVPPAPAAPAHPAAGDDCRAPGAGTRLQFSPWGSAEVVAPAGRPQQEPWGRGERELSRPWAALSQAPVRNFVPALSQWPTLPSPLISLEMELRNRLMEKPASHKNSCKQPECCVMTEFDRFLLFIYFYFYFLLKPENTVASAEGTGTFPD